MVLSEIAVLPLCPWGGGSLAVTALPTWMTRKPPTTIAAITSRVRISASRFIGGAVAGRLAFHPDADPGPAHGEHDRPEQDHDEQGPEGLGEHRPPEPRRGARRDPEFEERRRGRAQVRAPGGRLAGAGAGGHDVAQVGARPGTGGHDQLHRDPHGMLRRELDDGRAELDPRA